MFTPTAALAICTTCELAWTISCWLRSGAARVAGGRLGPRGCLGPARDGAQIMQTSQRDVAIYIYISVFSRGPIIDYDMDQYIIDVHTFYFYE